MTDRRPAVLEVVAALIRENGRFLVGRRPAGKKRGGLWEFVGGKVEPGETREQALIRECREELGVTVSVGRVYAVVRHDYPDVSIRLTLFETAVIEGVPVAREHEALARITANDIPSYSFCPADESILQKLRQDAEAGKNDR